MDSIDDLQYPQPEDQAGYDYLDDGLLQAYGVEQGWNSGDGVDEREASGRRGRPQSTFVSRKATSILGEASQIDLAAATAASKRRDLCLTPIHIGSGQKASSLRRVGNLKGDGVDRGPLES